MRKEPRGALAALLTDGSPNAAYNLSPGLIFCIVLHLPVVKTLSRGHRIPIPYPAGPTRHTDQLSQDQPVRVSPRTMAANRDSERCRGTSIFRDIAIDVLDSPGLPRRSESPGSKRSREGPGEARDG